MFFFGILPYIVRDQCCFLFLIVLTKKTCLLKPVKLKIMPDVVRVRLDNCQVATLL
jgi:hypothetical protein